MGFDSFSKIISTHWQNLQISRFSIPHTRYLQYFAEFIKQYHEVADFGVNQKSVSCKWSIQRCNVIWEPWTHAISKLYFIEKNSNLRFFFSQKRSWEFSWIHGVFLSRPSILLSTMLNFLNNLIKSAARPIIICKRFISIKTKFVFKLEFLGLIFQVTLLA